MTRKATLTALAVFSAVTALAGASPALAITDGGRDETHTNVGLVRFTTVDGRFRCSGTLIAPKVVLTAGHCTGGPATNVYVSFDHPTSRSTRSLPGITPQGTRLAKPTTSRAPPTRIRAGTGKLSFSKQHDHGRCGPRPARPRLQWALITPAPLAPGWPARPNQGALKNQTFTLVGYGVDIGAKKAQIVIPRAALRRRPISRTSRARSSSSRSTPERLEGGRRIVLRRFRGGPAFLGQYVLGDASYVNSLSCNATREHTSGSTRSTHEPS